MTMANKTSAALDFIHLNNDVRLGVCLGSPVVVFNLPKIEGFFTDTGRIFEDTDIGPSEVHAEEIAGLVEAKLGRRLDPGELLVCRFEQNMLGQVKTQHVARWGFHGGFSAVRLTPEHPSIVDLRKMLLLNDAAANSMTSPLMTTQTFASKGYLYGQVMDKGYSGMLHYNGVNVPIANKTDLARLADVAAYQEIAGHFHLALPGLEMSLPAGEALALQTAAKDMHDEVLLHIQKNGPVRRLDAAMPELAATLYRAAQSQLSDINSPKGSPDLAKALRESADDLGRVTTVIETVGMAAANPLTAGAVLISSWLARRYMAARQPHPETKRPPQERG